MKIHFDQEVVSLNRLVTHQAAMVEKAVRNSLLSISDKNEELAYFVVVGDDTLDVNEVKIEEECLKVLALYQPVASDLRYIITLLKVNTELERIGDLAVNIAERALHMLSENRDIEIMDFTEMFNEVSQSLKKSLDAFLQHNCRLAEEVIESDDRIDEIHRSNMDRGKRLLQEKPDGMEAILDFMSISRNLERIADSCTNIGEDVVYQEQGKIIRHSYSTPREENR